MLHRVTASLESVADGRVVLVLPGPSGMALEAAVPGYLADRLIQHLDQRPDQPVTLATMVMLESPNQGATFLPRLLAFGDERERAFFNLLTTVKRLGPRKALRALAVEPSTVASWIVASDTRSLAKLPEIGKSLADAIALELKGKADRYAAWPDMPDDPDRPLDAPSLRGVRQLGASSLLESSRLPPAAAEAVEALVTLGQTRPEAERRVVLAMQRDAGLASAESIIAATFAPR